MIYWSFDFVINIKLRSLIADTFDAKIRNNSARSTLRFVISNILDTAFQANNIVSLLVRSNN